MGYARSNDEFFEVGKMVLYSLNFGNLSPDCKAIFQTNATTAVNQLSNPGERDLFQNAFNVLGNAGNWPDFIKMISGVFPYFVDKADPEISPYQSFSTTIKQDLNNYYNSSGNDKIVAFAKLQLDVKRGLGTVDDLYHLENAYGFLKQQDMFFPSYLVEFNYYLSRSKSSVTMSTESTQWISIYSPAIMSLQDTAFNNIGHLPQSSEDFTKAVAYLNSLLGCVSFCKCSTPTPPSANIKNQQGLSNHSAEAELIKTLEFVCKVLITANQSGTSKNHLLSLIQETALHPHTKKLLANALIKKL